ncbi:MAG: serine/threonine protein kinase [Calditrichaeota bacterium]|jgi:eukaryotic-like serine/threonine-protein kinase|nr:serine/threonine protein kinase [Calditrichota bacterium]
MSVINTVTDQNGVRYELSELLGRGGQGAVYAVKNGRLAVKIIAAGSQSKRDKLRNQLTFVRRLPLNDLAMAKPLEMLRSPLTGYIMELLTEMIPIKSMISPPRGQSHSPEWYLRSGGLKRRLLLLGNAAQVLSRLHGKGLVYSDPSPTNIFISEDFNNQEVWLIDVDNLQYESTPVNSVFTPGYGAPELVKGSAGVNTLTDVFAFTVLAFQILTLAHPFIGDKVNEGEPELEEQAFLGNLPWIDDPNDSSNCASFGVPRTRVLSPRLNELFNRSFGIGRIDPRSRPGMSELMEKLYNAADATIVCNDCSGTYYFTQQACPWCDFPRPTFVTAVLHIWDPKFGPQGGILAKPKGESSTPVIAGHFAISNNQSYIITKRLAFGHSVGWVDDPVVSVSLVNNQIKLLSLDGNSYSLFSPSGSKKTEIIDHEKTMLIKEREGSWRLHFSNSNTLHRVVSFELRMGEKP